MFSIKNMTNKIIYIVPLIADYSIYKMIQHLTLRAEAFQSVFGRQRGWRCRSYVSTVVPSIKGQRKLLNNLQKIQFYQRKVGTKYFLTTCTLIK